MMTKAILQSPTDVSPNESGNIFAARTTRPVVLLENRVIQFNFVSA
jgi:hypothetical protein